MASEVQHVVVVDEATRATYFEVNMFIASLQSIMYNHTRLLHLGLPCQVKTVLPTSYRRSPGTTCVRCSGGMQKLRQLHKRKSEYQQQRDMAGRMVTDMEMKGTVRGAVE